MVLSLPLYNTYIKIWIIFLKTSFLGHCELLMLMKEDFKNVLQASVQRQWDEVKNAMSAFNYFDGLDEVIFL